MKKIGFVGVGNMGSRMVDRLIAAGHELSVCDANPATLSAYAERGIKASPVPADVARADIVILMVADDTQLLDVVSGRDGIATAIDPAAPPILLIMSTGLPRTMLAVRDAVAPLGARVIEAPVSGGVGGAERGTLAIMMGGDAATIDELMPVVRCLGQNIFRCGEFGSAQTVKLINNMIGLTNNYVVAEIFELAVKAGVDLNALAPVLEASTGRNYATQDVRMACFQYANWASSPVAFEALSRIVRKDMGLAKNLIADVGVAAPVMTAIADLLGDNSEAVYRRWHDLGALELAEA